MKKKKFNEVLPRNLDEAVEDLKPEEVEEPGPLGLKILVPKGLKEILE